MAENVPAFLWQIFQELRQHKFPLSPADWNDLRTALRLGFGWKSKDDLTSLCITLWAKSPRDADLIRDLFARQKTPEWDLPLAVESQMSEGTSSTRESVPLEPEQDRFESVLQPPVIEKTSGLPPIFLEESILATSRLIQIPQYPVTFREVAQAWRRVRSPLRFGPKTEIDIRATIEQAANSGIMTGPVLIPPRRNTSPLLLLVDVQGSMTPFHPFVREVCSAIASAGNFGRIGQFFFHDVPAEGLDETLLATSDLFPTLDAFLGQIDLLAEGFLFKDAELTEIQEMRDVLADHATDANVIIISDAGAARGHYDFLRLLDTVGWLKYLRKFTRTVVWLNPLPNHTWENTTAAQIARHIPMFSLEPEQLTKAVVALKEEEFAARQRF